MTPDLRERLTGAVLLCLRRALLIMALLLAGGAAGALGVYLTYGWG